MELKEFIKDTVTQIADAVTELNGGTSKYPLTINWWYRETGFKLHRDSVKTLLYHKYWI